MGSARHFAILAQYNAVFNRQLNRVLARHFSELPRDILVQINHIFVMDRLWMDRLCRSTDAKRLSIAMDAAPFHDTDDWWPERAALDREIGQFVNRTGAFGDEIAFATRADNVAVRCRIDDALTHLFNHQSLHRGEIVNILWRHGVDFGNTDILPLVVSPWETVRQAG